MSLNDLKPSKTPRSLLYQGFSHPTGFLLQIGAIITLTYFIFLLQVVFLYLIIFWVSLSSLICKNFKKGKYFWLNAVKLELCPIDAKSHEASYQQMIILIFSASAQYFLPPRNCLFSSHSILEQPWVEHKIIYLISSFSFPLAKLSNEGSYPLRSSFWLCTTHKKRIEGSGAFFWSLQAGSLQWKQTFSQIQSEEERL